ncbi:AttH domain [Trypanosoma melophagium]|uniref:AttH domain n=1 Tax=Trypanosoma melophagium TaxID=715481 RepID=UPI00351A32E9|nr:AttH domain [Trypanosoma melophagium]
MLEEPVVKKQKSEQEGAAALHERMRSSWPKDVPLDDNTDLNESPFELCVEHDAPHDNCAFEWWRVHGRVGANNRFGVLVTFLRLVVADGGGEGLPPACDFVKYAAGVAWVIVDHAKKKYYRFVDADHQAPLIAAFLTANMSYIGNEYFLQALSEQFKQDRLPLPERPMTEPASVHLEKLNLSYDGNHISVVGQAKGGKSSHPSYKLSLSGTTFESGDTQMSEEVKATVELTFQPTQRPVLHGKSGVVELGKDWRHDIFHYFLPHCKVMEGTINLTRASDDLEVARSSDVEDGRLWMEHGFGCALPQTDEEPTFLEKKSQQDSEVLLYLWNCCSIQLDNETKDIVSIIYAANPENWKLLKAYAVYQCGKTGKSERYHEGIEINVDSASQYRSDKTGVLFPTRWTLNIPFREGSKLELTLEATFPDQEFITLVAQPSLWVGTVGVRGKIIFSDGTFNDITGNGLMESRGKGSLHDIPRLFELLREVTTTLMEKPEVSCMKSLEEIVSGPSASAVGTVKTLMSLHNQTFSDAHLVVFTAFLAVYGYIFHHGKKKEEVLNALRWSHGKWFSYFGSTAIDIKTITLRAFMLSELTTVLQKCCASWIPSYVQPSDLVMSPPSSMEVLLAAHKVEISSISPPRVNFETEVSRLDISKLKGLIDGKWIFDESRGTRNMDAFLAAQGINVMWRTFIVNATFTFLINVDEDKRTTCIIVETPLYNKKYLIPLDGVHWEWHSTGRGLVHSRASVLPGGNGIYMETVFPNKMMECKWYTFEDGEKTMVELMKLYKNNDIGKDNVSVQPISVCVRYFTIYTNDNADGGGVH